MFGKSEWFTWSRAGRLRPVSWYGWLYQAGWTAVLMLPTLVMLTRHRCPEGLIWAAAMGDTIVG